MSFELDGNTQFFAVADKGVTEDDLSTALTSAGLQEVLGSYNDQPKGTRPNITIRIADYLFWSSSKDADAEAVTPFLSEFPGEPLALFGYVRGAAAIAEPPTSAATTSDQIDFDKENQGKTPDDNNYLYPPNGKDGPTNLRNVKYTEADKKYDPDACLEQRTYKGTPDFPENANPYTCAPEVPFKARYYTKLHEGAGWSTHQVEYAFDQCTPHFCQVVASWAGKLEVYDDEDWMLIVSIEDASGYYVDMPIYVDEATYASMPDSGTYTVIDREQFIDWYEFHSDDFDEESQGD